MTKRVTIEADAVGQGKISIDGVDMSGLVQGVSLSVFRGQPTEVLVKFIPGQVSADIEGAVLVQSSEMQVLDMLDPKDVDQEAMNRLEFGEDRTLTEIVIEVIKEKLGAH